MDSTCLLLSIFIPVLCTAGLSHEEQVCSFSLTSGHYNCHTWEWKGAGTNVYGHKISLKDLQKSQFLPSLSRPLDPLLSWVSLQTPLQREAWGSKRGGEIVYLTLICSGVSFREMTCNLGGKGQLCLSLLFRGPIYRPEALLPSQPSKLQTISGWPRCCVVHSCGHGLKEETPSRFLSPSPSWAH